MRADQNIDLALRQRGQRLRRGRRVRAPSAAPCAHRRPWPAVPASPCAGAQRISVGAISAPCVPASTAFSSARNATIVLPAPTSPCSSRSMRCGAAMSASISPIACSCASVSAKGRAAIALAFSLPSPFRLRPFFPPHLRADQQQRELVGQQLVIGQALARRRVGLQDRARSPAHAPRSATRRTRPSRASSERRGRPIPA